MKGMVEGKRGEKCIKERGNERKNKNIMRTKGRGDIVCHLKYNKKQSRTAVRKLTQKVHPRVPASPNLPRDARVKVTLVDRPLLTPIAHKLCRCEHGVHEQNVCSFSNIISHTKQRKEKVKRKKKEDKERRKEKKMKPSKTRYHRVLSLFTQRSWMQMDSYRSLSDSSSKKKKPLSTTEQQTARPSHEYYVTPSFAALEFQFKTTWFA
jgi:hypothetical protein